MISVLAEASDGEKRLHRDLLITGDYNKGIRPRRDPAHTVLVDIELDLNHLMKLVSRRRSSFKSGRI